jgi:hypothetical protein
MKETVKHVILSLNLKTFTGSGSNECNFKDSVHRKYSPQTVVLGIHLFSVGHQFVGEVSHSFSAYRGSAPIFLYMELYNLFS